MWHRIPIIVVHNKQISLLQRIYRLAKSQIRVWINKKKSEWVSSITYFNKKPINTSILLRNNNGIDEVINKRGVGGDRAGAMY